ncbi:MAG TPA: hypothetical protein O0X42_00645 [Methanocorpusculum sp.]|nr:hypothetical protein [Methanocorpusculum sp.]
MSVSESAQEAYPRADLSEKLVPIEIRTVKTRKELAAALPRLHEEKFTRWNQVPELQNRQSLEVMLRQYRSVKLVAHVLNCSGHMVYAAMSHHGVTYPRVYSSKRTEMLLNMRTPRNKR